MTADPALAVNLVRQPASARMQHAMSNNFGFGGSNCTLVFTLAQ
jgi:3-oxoacyl-(acyl-carrier-protein) synthase